MTRFCSLEALLRALASSPPNVPVRDTEPAPPFEADGFEIGELTTYRLEDLIPSVRAS